MTKDTISLLVAGKCPDPAGTGMLSVPVRSIIIQPRLDGQEDSLIKALDMGLSFAVVSDYHTRPVLGKRIEKILTSLGKVKAVELPMHPHADEKTAKKLAEDTKNVDAIIAVGSGTINDLCKYVSAQQKIPYAVFATAPSMNGYTSANAAITVNGLKKSLPAQSARGAFFDLEILSASPKKMIQAGLGDSMCRSTAQADWQLSHLFLDTAYRETPFLLLTEDEETLLQNASALIRNDIASMDHLVRTLILSGFGMTLCGGSYPASQGEHLISHYAEMMSPLDQPQALHGEQI